MEIMGWECKKTRENEHTEVEKAYKDTIHLSNKAMNNHKKLP